MKASYIGHTNEFLQNLSIKQIFFKILNDDTEISQFIINPVNQHLQHTVNETLYYDQ